MGSEQKAAHPLRHHELVARHLHLRLRDHRADQADHLEVLVVHAHLSRLRREAQEALTTIPTSRTNEGNTMSGVEDVRAGVMTAKEKANSSLGALQQAKQAIDEAQQILGQVTAGSSQPEVTQAHGMLQEAAQGIDSQQNVIQGAIQSAESYAQRL